MIHAPTLSRFLLRSRALWLTVFTLVFLSWAWWDSERYRTDVELLIGSSIDFCFWTGDGGYSVYLGEKSPYHPGYRFSFHRELCHPPWGYRKTYHFAKPQYYFSPLLSITLLISTIWHAWRWYVIRKHFQAPSQSNGFS